MDDTREIQQTNDAVEEAINDDTETSTMREVIEEETPVVDVEDNSLTKELEDIMSAPETQEVENTNEIESLRKEVAELKNLVNELLDKATQPELVPEISDSEEEVIASYEKSMEECEGEECENTLEKRVASLETKLAEMIHAYETIENDKYDLKSEEQEMEHVQKNKEVSEKILQKEHELDLSKQEDRGKLNADFLSDVLSEFNIETNPVNEAVQEVVENEELVEEPEVEDNPIDGNVQMVDSVAPVEAANEEVEKEEESEEQTEPEEVLDDFEEEISDEQLIEIYNSLTPEQVVKVEVETEDDEPADVYFPVTELEKDTDETVVELLKERGVLDADYFVLLKGNVEEVYPATKEQFVEFLRNSNLLEVAEEPTEDSVEENINEEV